MLPQVSLLTSGDIELYLYICANIITIEYIDLFKRIQVSEL